jgi:proline iminopeptidase
VISLGKFLALAGALLVFASHDAQAQTSGAHQFQAPGARLWYRVAGPPGAPLVVFLHGGPGQGSQTFAKFAGPALERDLRMVYLDQRGSGRSERPAAASAYSITQMTDDVEALRVQLGAQRIALVGHSFGTILALEYAARYPEHVSRMVLAGAAPDMPALADGICERLATVDPAAYARAVSARSGDAVAKCDFMAAYQGEAKNAFFHRNMYPDLKIGALVDASDQADGLGNSGESADSLLAQGLTAYRFDRPHDVKAPVLVIAGGADFQTVEAPQRALANALPHGRMLTYEGDGHFMFVEEPERFARDVVSFLAAGR